MAATCNTEPSKRTLPRRSLRNLYKDRLHKAVFIIDLQLESIRQSIADVSTKAVMKVPCPRETLLTYSPLNLMRDVKANEAQWNINAEEFRPWDQLDNVLEYLTPVGTSLATCESEEHALELVAHRSESVHASLVPLICIVQEPALGATATQEVSDNTSKLDGSLDEFLDEHSPTISISQSVNVENKPGFENIGQLPEQDPREKAALCIQRFHRRHLVWKMTQDEKMWVATVIIQRSWLEHMYRQRFAWRPAVIQRPDSDTKLKNIREIAQMMECLLDAHGNVQGGAERLSRVVDIYVHQLLEKMKADRTLRCWPPPVFLHTVASLSARSFHKICRIHLGGAFEGPGCKVAFWYEFLMERIGLTTIKKGRRKRKCCMLLATLVYTIANQNISKQQLALLEDLLFQDHANVWLHTSYYSAVQWNE